MRKNVTSIGIITIVAGAMLSVSVTAVLAQQQPPRPTPFSERILPGTQPPRAMAQGHRVAATEGITTRTAQPPRPTPFSERILPGTQPPRAMAQGHRVAATEATTTRTAAENEKAAAERAARAKAFVSPRVVPFNVRQVAVECNGNCSTITLQNACGLTRTPIAVDCVSVRDWNGSSCGSANGRCASFPIVPTDILSWYCDDTGGWDANVYCAQ